MEPQGYSPRAHHWPLACAYHIRAQADLPIISGLLTPTLHHGADPEGTIVRTWPLTLK
jgi:hypothetical protein